MAEWKEDVDLGRAAGISGLKGNWNRYYTQRAQHLEIHLDRYADSAATFAKKLNPPTFAEMQSYQNNIQL